jgi:hypothetical protein
MNINFLKKSIFFIAMFLFLACNNYDKYETDDYILKIPHIAYNIKPEKDSIQIFFKKHQTKISVCVIKKSRFEFTPQNELNDCLAKELSNFMLAKQTANIITRHTEINGYAAIEVSGTNTLKNNEKYYWTFAIIPTKYFFYIIRLYSPMTNYSFNEYIHQKIINSFYLKNITK